MSSRSIYKRKWYNRKLYTLYKFSGAHFYQRMSVVPGISKAIVEDDLWKVVELVKSGSSLNVFDSFGNGPLHIAVAKNSEPILEFLLSQNKKHINQQNFLGETPLFKAVVNEKYNLVEKLISYGAKTDVPNNSHVTPLHLAVRAPKMAHLLIKSGADINYRDVFNQTPLHCAVEFGCLETVCMLLYYNADVSIKNRRNFTPFMVALERKNLEIQEALFEYVEDYENTTIDSQFSVLGLALIHDSPFAEDMIHRGADVDNVNMYVNGAYFLTLHYSRLKGSVNISTFKLVWDRMHYEPVEKVSVLGGLFLLQPDTFHGVVDIFINTDKFSDVARSVSKANDFCSFAIRAIEHHLPLDKLTMLFCRLLIHGYTPNENDVTVIFNHWGYCDLFRILLHMSIRRTTCFCNLDKIPTRLIYDVQYGRKVLLNNLVSIIQRESYPLDALMAMIVFRVLDNFVYPPLINAYLSKQKTDCVTLKIMALSKIPSLVELARNRTREHIIHWFQVSNSCKLLSIINSLDIANIYKKILTLETVIYKPVFEENKFKRYIKMLKMTPLRKQVVDPLIESAIKNSVVID